MNRGSTVTLRVNIKGGYISVHACPPHLRKACRIEGALVLADAIDFICSLDHLYLVLQWLQSAFVFAYILVVSLYTFLVSFQPLVYVRVFGYLKLRRSNSVSKLLHLILIPKLTEGFGCKSALDLIESALLRACQWRHLFFL